MASVEGVWAKDIEEAFEEALAVYPPCGRRKIILSDEGKMYGRNELIARYIKMRTGKTRTRKQVSSHIQVLSRKRGREGEKVSKMPSQQGQQHHSQQQHSQPSPSRPPSSVASPAQLMNRTALPISPSLPSPTLQNPVFPPSPLPGIVQPSSPIGYGYSSPSPSPRNQYMSPYVSDPKPKKAVATHPDPSAPLIYSPSPSPSTQTLAKLNHCGPPRTSLFELSVFLECPLPSPSLHTFAELKDVDFAGPLEKVDIRQMYPKLPGLQQLYNRGPRDSIFLVKLWLNLTVSPLAGFLGITSKYHSGKSTSIKVSSKIFEHGKQVLEKIQVEYPLLDNNSYCYFFNRAPACEYATSLLERARECLLVGPARGGGEDAANQILNDIAVLQTVTDRDTQENLLTLLFIFEAGDDQLSRRVYKLTED